MRRTDTGGHPFIGDINGWLLYFFGLSLVDWTWRVTRWQGWTHCVGLLGIPLVVIWGWTRYFPSIAMRQFWGDHHFPRLNDIFVVTCEYGLLDIDVAMIEHTFGFWKEHKSIIDFPNQV